MKADNQVKCGRELAIANGDSTVLETQPYRLISDNIRTLMDSHDIPDMIEVVATKVYATEQQAEIESNSVPMWVAALVPFKGEGCEWDVLLLCFADIGVLNGLPLEAESLVYPVVCSSR